MVQRLLDTILSPHAVFTEHIIPITRSKPLKMAYLAYLCPITQRVVTVFIH